MSKLTGLPLIKQCLEDLEIIAGKPNDVKLLKQEFKEKYCDYVALICKRMMSLGICSQELRGEG